MMKPKRLASSIAYLASLLLTLFFAIKGEGILVFLFMIVQTAAMIYCESRFDRSLATAAIAR